jgi:polysaccharide export outer membrane protein
MRYESTHSVSRMIVTMCFLALVLWRCVPAEAQTAGAAPENAQSTPVPARDDYKIGENDVLLVTVSDAQEFGGKFRVSDMGIIEIPGVASPIHAEGQTPIQLAHSIRQALIDAKQLRDPKVGVFVEEYHGRTITVLGAVAKPAVYPLQKKTSVLEALSLAGGSLPNSGNTVTIVRGAASAEASGTKPGSVQIVDISRLVNGTDLSANVEVKNGDVINVSAAQVVYVVGAVTKPGGFVMSNPSAGISVIQAVALAEGFRSVAATHRGLIIRQSTSESARQEIPVDIALMMGGKEADMLLAPNDILYIPESGGKKALKAMTDVAMSAVNGIAIYGLGYRAAGAHP